MKLGRLLAANLPKVLTVFCGWTSVSCKSTDTSMSRKMLMFVVEPQALGSTEGIGTIRGDPSPPEMPSKAQRESAAGDGVLPGTQVPTEPPKERAL